MRDFVYVRCRWRAGSGLTLREYQALEAGDLEISFDIYLRIVDMCGWPKG